MARADVKAGKIVRAVTTMSRQDPTPDLSAVAAPRGVRGLHWAAPSDYAVRYDRIEGERSCDLGEIGVDPDGIWVTRSPEALMLEHPETWDAVERYRLGMVRHDPMSGCAYLAPEDVDDLDALTHALLMHMIAAHNRVVRRRTESRS